MAEWDKEFEKSKREILEQAGGETKRSTKTRIEDEETYLVSKVELSNDIRSNEKVVLIRIPKQLSGTTLDLPIRALWTHQGKLTGLESDASRIV